VTTVEPKPLTEHRREMPLVVTGWVALVVIFVAVWWAASHFAWVNPLFIGNPMGVLESFWEGVTGPLLWVDTVQTTIGALVGWILASAVAVLVAFAVSTSRVFERIVDPFITAMNSLPRVALAPLFLLWFGIGMTPKVVLSFSLAFFVVFGATMGGVRSVESDHVLIAHTMGLKKHQVFRRVVVPSAVPSIFSGLELGFIFGILGTVSGEMIAGSNGIGVQLQYAASRFDMNMYFAALIILIIITMLIAWLLRALRNRLLRWQATGTVVAR
jgi:NitT/TauT family transport system permease protein